RGDHTEPARPSDLEDDLRARADLIERQFLARGLVREVLRVRVQQLRRRVRGLHSGLESGDVQVDRRDALAADGGRDLVAVLLEVQPGEVTGGGAGAALCEGAPPGVVRG